MDGCIYSGKENTKLEKVSDKKIKDTKYTNDEENNEIKEQIVEQIIEQMPHMAERTVTESIKNSAWLRKKMPISL